MKINEANKLKIDLFLKQIQLLSKLHGKIGPKHIYYQLTEQNIPEQEIRQDLSEVFDSLIETNRNNPQMDVFVAGNWSYFCQFKSSEAWRAYETSAIKMYIPLKKENMQSSIQKIFDFINENNIHHCSRLARETRIDDLVIRVFSKEDADKIASFINNDNELVNNTYEVNPFTITDGNVGLAMDRILSYNDTLARYIYEYINRINDNNQIASVTSFKEFLQENLRQMKEKGDLSLQIKMCTGNNFNRLPLFLQTVEEITSLLIKVVDGSPKEALYEEFERINNPNYNKGQQNNYRDFEYVEMENSNKALLSELFRTMSLKYGPVRTITTLKEYALTGDANFITRERDLRNRIQSSTTFRTYVNSFNLEEYLKKQIQAPRQEVAPSKESILEEVCKQTYLSCQTEERKFSGKIQVAHLLIQAIANNYNCITRTNNARGMMKENIKPEEIKKLIKKTLEDNGYIIENETDLYELYATHIEHICQTQERTRGR